MNCFPEERLLPGSGPDPPDRHGTFSPLKRCHGKRIFRRTEISGQRLLADHMLPAVQRQNCLLSVHIRRRAQIDHVHLGIFQKIRVPGGDAFKAIALLHGQQLLFPAGKDPFVPHRDPMNPLIAAHMQFCAASRTHHCDGNCLCHGSPKNSLISDGIRVRAGR